MIGTIDQKNRKVTVIGAGVAGLLAAYRLDQAGFEVTVLETQDRAGGLISTTQAPLGISESAAHSFLAAPAVLTLCQELRVPLVPIHEKSHARYILRGGKLRRFPLTPGGAVTALWRAFTVRAPDDGAQGLSMGDWAERHLGAEAKDYLITPFTLGIHAALPSELLISAAFPKMVPGSGKTLVGHLRQSRRESKRTSKSGRAPRAQMMVPAEGMGSLVGALEENLKLKLGNRFRCGEEVTSLPENAGNIVLAVPAPEAGRILERHDGATAAVLRGVQYTPMVCVTVFLPRAIFKTAPRGVGVLIPTRENRRILGVLFNSSAFSGRVLNEDTVSLTVMMGSSLHPDYVMLADDEIKGIVSEELGAIFGLKGTSAASASFCIHRWKQALPIYSAELAKTWQTARAGWCSEPGHVLFGNYTGQISLRGMIETDFGFSRYGQSS